MNDNALRDEIYEELEDALAPEWATEAAAAWENARAVADDAGCDPEPIYHEQSDRFIPTTDAEYEWAMRKRAKAMKDAAEIEQQRDFEMDFIRRAFDRRINERKQTAAFFTDMIERAVEALPPDSKGKRTVKTVVGTAYTRTAPSFKWPDEMVLVAWAKEHQPDALRVKESTDKAELKARIKATGEVPEGVVVEPKTTVIIKEA